MEKWILENMELFVMVTDSDGNIVYCNKEIEELKKLSEYKAVSDSHIEFEDSIYDIDEITREKDGKKYNIFTFKRAELKKSAVDDLRKKLRCDMLTGVLTRSAFEESLVNTNMFMDQIPFSIIMCDVDDFKIINDSLGHLGGDRVLKLIGDTLLSSFRKDDIIARYGGDEFIIGIRDNDQDRIIERLEKVQQQLGKYSDITNINMSFGCTEYDYSISLEDNIKNADSALYYGKSHGKNRVIFWSDQMIDQKK